MAGEIKEKRKKKKETTSYNPTNIYMHHTMWKRS
jgi:hypothetical protein